MARQNLEEQDPFKPTRRPARSRAKKKTIGTLANPFVRQDGVQTAKLSFRASVECAGMLKAMAAKLEMEGIARNEWLEALIIDGIERGFRPRRRRESQPEEQEAG